MRLLVNLICFKEKNEEKGEETEEHEEEKAHAARRVLVKQLEHVDSALMICAALLIVKKV